MISNQSSIVPIRKEHLIMFLEDYNNLLSSGGTIEPEKKPISWEKIREILERI